MAARLSVTHPTHCIDCNKPLLVGDTVYIAVWQDVEQRRCGKCNRKVKGKFMKEGW